MTERALVHVSGALPTQGEWQTLAAMAKALVSTGFLPQEIKTAEQAVAIILKGRELNVPPMYALSNIVVIKGKPTCNAELMLALVYRDHGDNAIKVEESTAQRCSITYKRRDWPDRKTYSFTIEDATRAGLVGGMTWKAYPQAMLRARCISATCRMTFPDSIAGMYTPEELGALVQVTDEGRVEIESLPADANTNGHAHAPPALQMPVSHPTQSAPAQEPAVMTGEDIPADQAEEVAQLFDQPMVTMSLGSDSTVTEPVSKLWPKVLQMRDQLVAYGFTCDLPRQDQEDAFLVVWLNEKQALVDQKRRAQQAARPGR